MKDEKHIQSRVQDSPFDDMLGRDHVRHLTKIKFLGDGVVKVIDSLDCVSFVQVKVAIDDQDVHVHNFWVGGEI
jgi:hypothetical protein